MKNLVTYSSWTGNTKKIAHAIHEEIKGDILPMEEVKSWQDYDFLALGFFVDKGFANDEAKEFMEKIKDKKVGIFATLGAEPTSQHAIDTMKEVKEFLEENGNTVTHEFICQGAVDPKLIQKMRDMAARQGDKAIHPITPEREKRWQEAALHPNQNDLENAKLAFRDI